MLENPRVKWVCGLILHPTPCRGRKQCPTLWVTQLHVIESDVYQGVADLQFDIIVSNPPYILRGPMKQKWDAVLAYASRRWPRLPIVMA